MQRTIQKEIEFSGVGLHSGERISVALRPARADVGIQFVRSDLDRDAYIPARPESVIDTLLATRIGFSVDHSISTIEHFMAALYGFGIDNIIVEVDGPEMPILDGSAAPFLALIDECGIQELEGSHRKFLVVRQALEVVDSRDPNRFIRIEPAKKARIDYGIDFGANTPIGAQAAHVELNGVNFCREFSYARTFCFSDEVEAMQKRGLARGGSLENAVVLHRSAGSSGVLNENGLRDSKEFVRHKVLDCVGDLMLLGRPFLGNIIAHKAGHDLHCQLAAKMLAGLTEGSVEEISAQAAKSSVLKAFRFPQSLTDALSGTPALVVG